MKIATLIPAYKTTYIAELFASIQNQTHRPELIIVSDDSPGGAFRRALESATIRPLLAGLNIFIAEGPRTGGYNNMKHLIKLWNSSTDLVHIMLDDDIAYPEFYERHLEAHRAGDFSCTISRRWRANDTGFPLEGQFPPAAVAHSPYRILSLDSDVVFMTTVAECKNWFGEFSNTVFRSGTCPIFFKPEMGGVSYAGLWDLGAYLSASMIAPIGYIQDYLGFFRVNEQSHSASKFGPMMKTAVLGYAALALGGQRIGKISEKQARGCYATLGRVLPVHYPAEEDMQIFCSLLPKMAQGDISATSDFEKAWMALLAKHQF